MRMNVEGMKANVARDSNPLRQLAVIGQSVWLGQVSSRVANCNALSLKMGFAASLQIRLSSSWPSPRPANMRI